VKLEREEEIAYIIRQADGSITSEDGSAIAPGRINIADFVPVMRRPNGVIEFQRWRPTERGPFPEGDSQDLRFSPLRSVIMTLGRVRSEEAVPVLISILDHDYGGHAALALGNIGDARAIPPLLKKLRRGGRLDMDVVSALGRLQCKEAAPVLVRYLLRYGYSIKAQKLESILDALFAIGDEQVVPFLEGLLTSDASEESKSVARRYLVQVKSPDPVGALLELLESETDIYQIDKTIDALSQYEDERVIVKLTDLAATSDSATIRDDAIGNLRTLGNRDSLLALVSLLKVDFPKELNDVRRWKGAPDDFSIYFPEEIVSALTGVTDQDFGQDASRWRSWISENVN
jgi:HEAT repeat protein